MSRQERSLERGIARLKKVASAPDGNCFYRSAYVSASACHAWPNKKQLKRIDDKIKKFCKEIPRAMFEGTVEEILQWMRYCAMVDILERKTYEFYEGGKEKCIADTITDGTFADHVQINAVANILQINFAILKPGGNVVFVYCDSDNAPFVRISYKNEHYDAAVPASTLS